MSRGCEHAARAATPLPRLFPRRVVSALDKAAPIMETAAMPEPPPIHLSRPDLTDAERRAVWEVLSTPDLSLGPTGPRFEAAFAQYIGAPHAVALASGTAGLHVALLACGLEEGECVLTTPFSFIATANAIVMAGGEPLFADIDEETLNLSPEAAEETLDDSVRALLPVDVFGLPCDLPGFERLAKRHGLTLIDDACEALGAEVGGARVGAYGDAAVFAFYPNKQMTTGEGGMLVCRDREVAELARSLRNQGRSAGGGWLAHERLGFNYRLPDFSAALGLVQLARLPELLAKRRRVAEWYAAALADEPRLLLPREAGTGQRSWFVYVVRLRQADGARRDSVLQHLRAARIQCGNYFPPIHLQPFYRRRYGYREGMFPVCERVSASTLALPFHPLLTESEVARVVAALRSALDAVRA